MSDSLAFIIEDDYDLSTVFAGALQAAGFETEIIRAGDKALERLAVITPDVVVLDLHLPHVEGVDILEYIRGDPRLAETRVIIITGDAVLANSPSLQEATVQILIKPVTFKRLRNLARLLKLSSRRVQHG